VTTALGSSRLGHHRHGIVNEVYWPSRASRRSAIWVFYLVGNGRWIDLKREHRYRLLTPGPGLRRSPSCITPMTISSPRVLA